MTTFPKPTPKKKGAKARLDKKHADKVRQEVMDRDGGCRFPADPKQPNLGGVPRLNLLQCDGPLEWAHLPDWRRSRTMGQAPEERHTTAGSMMLCRRHHTMLDQNQLMILFTGQLEGTSCGADGPISWYLVLGES
jgi:hypothetical protein